MVICLLMVLMEWMHPGSPAVLLAQPVSHMQQHQQPGSDGILFVYFSVTGNGVEITQAAVVPGRLKTPRAVAAGGSFQIELLDGSGQVLQTVSEDDPLMQRYCYVDDAGDLSTLMHQVDEAEIMIRMPWRVDADRIRLIRKAQPVDAKQPPVVLSVTEFHISDYLGGRP